MNKQKVNHTLHQIHITMTELPTTQRRALYERLRHKIGADIMAIIKEEEVELETLATMMGMGKAELKKMIWDKDLKLSELVKLLCKLGAEMWPLIRVGKK